MAQTPKVIDGIFGSLLCHLTHTLTPRSFGVSALLSLLDTWHCPWRGSFSTCRVHTGPQTFICSIGPDTETQQAPDY